MSKSKTIEVNMQDLEKLNASSVEIKSAQLKESLCNYSYELVAGTGKGDLITRKGSAIIHDDLDHAFKRLNVHLALTCEEIESTEIREIESLEEIDLSEDHDEGTLMYSVSRFLVSGLKINDDGEGSVVLEGVKILSTGEFVGLKSPRIKWDGDYIFINELRASIDSIKEEVEAYMNGKSAPQFEQQSIEFEM